jgi:hypothetical protein
VNAEAIAVEYLDETVDRHIHLIAEKTLELAIAYRALELCANRVAPPAQIRPADLASACIAQARTELKPKSGE